MTKKTPLDPWPDLEADQLAWKKARLESPNAPLSTIATRAQKIKEAEVGRAEVRPGRKKTAPQQPKSGATTK